MSVIPKERQGMTFWPGLSLLLGLLVSTHAALAGEISVKVDYEYRGIYQFTDMVDTAMNYLASEVTAQPANARVRFGLATLYYRKGMVQEAKQQFESIVTLHPDDADGYFHLGMVFLHEGNFEQFREHMEKTISLNPSHKGAYNNLAKAYVITKDYDKARDVWETAIKRMSKEESFYFNQSILLMSHYKDKRDIVLRNMTSAISLSSKEEYFFILGWAHLEQHQYDAARSAMQKAFDLNPKNVYALLAVATTYKELGNFEKAIETAERAKGIYPGNPADIDAEIQAYKDAYKKWKKSQERSKDIGPP